MFNRSARVLTLCTLTSMLVLGGCATSPQVEHVSLGAISDSPVPAMPRVNKSIAARMAKNALMHDDSGIQLGAGDRFGRQLSAHYIASIRLYEQNRMFAEVGAAKSSY